MTFIDESDDFSEEKYKKALKKLREDSKPKFSGLVMAWYDGRIFTSGQELLEYISAPSEDDPQETTDFG